MLITLNTLFTLDAYIVSHLCDKYAHASTKKKKNCNGIEYEFVTYAMIFFFSCSLFNLFGFDWQVQTESVWWNDKKRPQDAHKCVITHMLCKLR